MAAHERSRVDPSRVQTCIRSLLRDANNNGDDVGDGGNRRSRRRKFVETVELQITLQHYNPQADKRFSAQVRLFHPVKPRLRVCVFGDDEHIAQAKALNVEYITVEDLKKLNKNKKLIKNLFQRYHIILASETLIRMLPRLIGPSLGKIGRFPHVISHNDDMASRIKTLQSTLKFQLKKTLNLNVAVGMVTLTEAQLCNNVTLAINFLASLTKKHWQNIKKIDIKSTMGRPYRLYD
eukprot:TRINITY_DN8210_c0_g1_i2.p1 TRINITY_DN8210_c0_g1~~TRINITY_DN8210_c0_g1_i2.p1  ORF type:complete len:236 (+),score=30.31 TRINITY_DN8210_c0_g1_i2:21-728(+)